MGLPLFARISKRRLRKIASLAQIQRFSPGDIVVQFGEPADAFYLSSPVVRRWSESLAERWGSATTSAKWG